MKRTKVTSCVSPKRKRSKAISKWKPHKRSNQGCSVHVVCSSSGWRSGCSAIHTTFRHAWTHFYFLLLSNCYIWWLCQQQELFTLTLSTASLFFCAFSSTDSWHCRKRGSSPCWCISGSCSLITIFPLRRVFRLVEILGWVSGNFALSFHPAKILSVVFRLRREFSPHFIVSGTHFLHSSSANVDLFQHPSP